MGPGDVLFSNVRTYLRNIALVPDDLDAQLCSTGFTVLRPTGAYEPDLLFYQVLTDRFIDLVTPQQTGSQYPATSDRVVMSATIPVAPLAEQMRIVEKAQGLLARANAARDHLARVSQILKRFRQAVLDTACSGRLTEEWRERNPQAESVGATVQTIRLRRMAAAKSLAQKEKIKEIYEYSEESDSSELPECWRFIALNKLCASFDYGTSAKSHPSGRMPVLRMGNIQNGKIDWSDLVYTSDDEEIERYSLLPNTVLFNRTNSPELVGKTAIYQGERPAIFAGYLIRIVNLLELDPRYLNFCLSTNHAREFCLQVKTDGVSQSNINAQRLGMFEVPYCPLDEQHEIVRRVEGLFNLADSIEKRVDVATKCAEKLTQAILAKAFRGELVPTEAELARREGRDYEPASVLLERIKAERAATVSQPSGRNSVPGRAAKRQVHK
jgi:type I restriction enzyme S subunit